MKTAAEIMDTTSPRSPPTPTPASAIELLAKTEKGAIPVVDEERRVVGIVSESDLVLSDEEADLHLPLYFDLMGAVVFLGSIKHFEERLNKAFATKVSELMTADPETVSVDDDAETVARRIAETHHNHLPVVDGDGRLAGLVTRADALAALVDSDSMARATARIDFGAVERNCARLKEEVGRTSSSARWSRPTATVTAAPLCRRRGRGWSEPACGRDRRRGGADRPRASAHPAADDGSADAGGARRRARRGVGDLRLARRIPRSRRRTGPRLGRPARVHVKHDSGMGRLGNRDPSRVIAIARACAANENLELAGIWTHFATADEPDSDFFGEQLERFSVVAEAVRREFPDVIVHAANSAAVLRDRRSHFDMVRCGVAIYGLDPFQQDPAEHDLRRPSRCTPTSPTSSASPPATVPATAGPGGRRRPAPTLRCCRSAMGTGSAAASRTMPRC